MFNAYLSLQGITVILSAVFVVVCILFGARVWLLRGRVRSSTMSYAADAGLYLAFVLNIVEMGLCTVNILSEMDIRKENLDDLTMEAKLLTKPFLLRIFVVDLVYIFELWAMKLAYLSYYFNLRSYMSKVNKLLYLSTCLYTAAGLIVVFVTTLTRCTPVSSNWTFNPAGGCIATSTIEVNAVLAGINISTDLLILVLGLHIISGLAIGSRQKAALFFAVSLGVTSIICTAVRFIMAFYSISNPQNGFIDQYHLILALGALEVTFAFVAFCLPSFQRMHCSRKRLRIRNSMSMVSSHRGQRNEAFNLDDAIEMNMRPEKFNDEESNIRRSFV